MMFLKLLPGSEHEPWGLDAGFSLVIAVCVCRGGGVEYTVEKEQSSSLQ